MKLRVGLGYDVHQLEEGREFCLGGVKIDHHKGARGHSDADVVIHAICDALLGALSLGDIGQHFPDSDPAYKGADSKHLLKEVMKMIDENNYRVNNIDISLCLEKPKIATYIPAIKKELCPILNIDLTELSIKATTSEQMGFVGKEEGVEAHAVALLISK